MTAPDAAVSLAPMRSLDDFVLGAARFQLPPAGDLQRWANRVVQNVLYYQTNYLAVLAAVVVIIGVLHPQELMLGVIVVAASLVGAAYLARNHANVAQLRRQRPAVFVAVTTALIYLLLQCVGSLLVLTFCVCLPLSVMFVHASLRLRNLKNRINNKIEALGFKKTPMGLLFNALGLEMEKYLL